VYGIKDPEEAVATARRIAANGFHVIVNETVDIKDGGVSGVILGNTLEFSPDDTPRCVEKPGVASLPRSWGMKILRAVYGFKPEIDVERDHRLEFSIHPVPRGWRYTHTLGWEIQRVEHRGIKPSLAWPNRFSRFLGDKVYGLLVAWAAGLSVPKTTVVNRRLAPFSFGSDTGRFDNWVRTCPREQIPGKYTTVHGWTDPYKLMATEDPVGEEIAAIIVQRAIRSNFSGALVVSAKNEKVIEGKSGEGEPLMKGVASPEQLPEKVRDDVLDLYRRAAKRLGPVRFEWVHDGDRAWIVQLHRGATETIGSVIVPGNPPEWRAFNVSAGLEALRRELSTLNRYQHGIVLVGQVGLTSHMADIVRKAGIAARIEPYGFQIPREKAREVVYVRKG
jgi:hypothetical protein